MSSRQNPLTSFITYLTLLLVFVVLAEPASAQTAAESAEATKSEVVSVEPASGSTSDKAVAVNAEADPVGAKTDSANAKADPAKGQPPPSTKAPPPPPVCRRIKADVVALAQPLMLNRLGAAIPDGLVFALRSDLDASGTRLRASKRPRPLVLRANVGDCLEISFTNMINPQQPPLPPSPPPAGQPTPKPLTFPGTKDVSIHIQGMEWVEGSKDDGSYVGLNNTSLASPLPAPSPSPPLSHTRTYTLYAKNEGTFLLYTMGDTSTQGDQLLEGLFGALNVEPATAEWYRSQVTADELALATYNANRLPANAALTNCNASNHCTLTITGTPNKQVKVIKTSDGNLNTLDNHPLINYDAVYPAGSKYLDGTPIAAGTPILKMLDANNNNNIVYSDLTAIITGPGAGRFHGTTGPNNPEPPCNAEHNPLLTTATDPLFCANPAAPDRKQPYREITVIYHGSLGQIASQAFPVFSDATMKATLEAGKDAFAINYGTGGIGAEIYANRIGLGPMGDCVDCKYEEFFLSAWSVGDPAMLVDKPANSNQLNQQNTFLPPCNSVAAFEGTNPPTSPKPACAPARNPVSGSPYTINPLAKANVAFFPDDPSNVYHSYINDHVKFRILHGGVDVTHVHHQHAHQWLQSPNSDEGSYLDSQMISPGASYTLEMVYNGSGNRNKVVGDSIFHCHFYPHFAAGMWAMWRTHDVFESGTYVYPQNTIIATKDVSNQVVPGSRALPDGEIKTGTPNPAVVPMPTLPMAPLPAYAQVQNNVQIEGVTIPHGSQIVIGGTCQSNKINGLDVIGGCTNGQHLNGTVINSQFNGTQMTGQFQPSTNNQLLNPGFPYFIPGIAGARAPHPPLDFAPDGAGGFLDGGLPRHLVTGGSISYERHNKLDWSKDFATLNAVGLPEDGTAIEKAAIAFFSKRCYATFLPDGTQGLCPSSNSTPPQSTLNTPPTGFILNGLPLGPQSGAPFADPAVDDNGKAVGLKRTYKAAAIQLNVTFNKKGWHFEQQRILTLWQDVQPSYDYKYGSPGGRQPEPLFFRGNSGDIIEYWHTNLVPNYYLVDDFQVRTPTDILGQHIHLVKFDVTSSDGAANGFNYEDGTYSPQEVQDMIEAINATGGLKVNGSQQILKLKPPPKEIIDCSDPNVKDPYGRCKVCTYHLTPTYRPMCPSWFGAQTTIQRWYLDPLLDSSSTDRTLRTVFTHDHFGPSTHQQAGLYAGLLVEPMGSTWRNSEDGTVMGRPLPQPPVRPDGGPTSWKADILTHDKDNKDVSYREFMLEFQDFQLAYATATVNPNAGPPKTKPGDDPNSGWLNKPYAVNPPPTPQLISTAINPTPGTQTVNYLSEPLAWRVGQFGDLSYAYDNNMAKRVDPGSNPEPMTPLLRAYENDNVQIRILVGAHTFAHQFNLEGPTWFSEPSWKNSGYRSTQAMGLSEHFELLFHVPPSSAPNTNRKCPDGMSPINCVDYLYSPSLDEIGLANGLWGIFRAYDPRQPATKLQFLTNNTPAMNTNMSYSTCPTNLTPPAVKRVFNVTAVTAQRALANISPVPGVNPPVGRILFNSRPPTLHSKIGIMYVRSEDLDAQGKLKPGTPVEPLVLRANAGDCIEVNLTNALYPTADVFKQKFAFAAPFNGVVPGTNQPLYRDKMSGNVGLHPQLLSYDAATSNGINVGWNVTWDNQGNTIKNDQVVPYGKTVKYQWYAGKIDRDSGGNPVYTPVEFGSLNLFPSDPVYQHINGLFGSMIIEPQGVAGQPTTWKCGDAGNLVDCDSSSPAPTTRASATITYNVTEGNVVVQKTFREFALMISDNIIISQGNKSAVNYRTEPQSFRYAGNSTQDFSCMLSNQLIHPTPQDPQTPILTAAVGDAVRFRMTHPFGTGTSQVFTVHGHVWQRNPYTGDSKALGTQLLSQWLGSRDNHGSSDHFDLLIDKAGGEFGQAGDYLYTAFVPNQAKKGAWGIFRVGQPGVPGLATPACTPVTAPPPTPYPKKDERELERFIRQPINTESPQVKP